MTYLFLSFTAAIFLHLVFGALTIAWCGVKITEICYGTGPKLVSFGKITIRLIPISGYARMLDSRENNLEEHELQFAYNLKPSFVRAFILVSGSISLILIAELLIGKQAFDYFTNAFGQITRFILSPTQDAQVYIQKILDFTETSSIITIFSITLTKIAAINLLPIPALNGGNALLELINLNKKHRLFILKAGISVILLMLLSVGIAIINFIWF